MIYFIQNKITETLNGDNRSRLGAKKLQRDESSGKKGGCEQFSDR